MQKDKDLRKFLSNILKRHIYADILMLRGRSNEHRMVKWLFEGLVPGCYPPVGSSQVHNLSCENEFYLHENEKSFPFQRLSTLPRFDTQARGISEIVYYVLISFPLSMQGFSTPELWLLTPSVECACNSGRDGFYAFALEIRAFRGR